MTSLLPPSPILVPLVAHLLAGTLLGAGLVGISWLNESKPRADYADFPQHVLRDLAPWGLLGAVGGFLGGVVCGFRPHNGSNVAPSMRFWMVALGSGGVLNLGAIALQTAPSTPTSENGGPILYVVVSLIFGWLLGVLFGAVGSPFAQALFPMLAALAAKATSGLGNGAKLFRALLAGILWALFWGVLVALLTLLVLEIVLLSRRAGSLAPALAVGGTCGCLFFALRYLVAARAGTKS